MDTIGIVLIVIGVISLSSIIYFFIQTEESFKRLKRNNEVYYYRNKLAHRCFPDTKLIDKILNKYTYKEMVYSSKPLEDTYWFTPEEIEEINNNYVYHLMRTHLAEKSKE